MEVLYQSEPGLTPAASETEEDFLPEGYDSGEDIFAEEASAGEHGEARAPEQSEAGSRKLKFTARVDHKDIEQEIDETQLPELYQKAQVTERVQAKLAKQGETLGKVESLARRLGYSTAEEMIRAAENDYKEQQIRRLTDQGTPREVAESYVNLMASEKSKGSEAPGRDFLAELRELVQERPELGSGQLPDPVTQKALSTGRSLLTVFAEYERDQVKAELERIREENRILKQNQGAAQRAPVKGATGGGGVDVRPRDPFLEGFDADRRY